MTRLTTTQQKHAQYVLLDAPVAPGPYDHEPSTALIPAGPADLMVSPTRHLVTRHRELVRASEQADLDLLYMGCAPTFNEARVVEGHHTDWVAMNMTQDPLYHGRQGRFIMPTAVHNKLQRIVQSGIDFPAVFVAHEVPKGSVVPGQPVPLEAVLPPPPRDLWQRIQGMERWAQAFNRTITTSLQVIAGATRAVVTAPLALGSAIALDPVLFGVVPDPQTGANGEYDAALWFYLAHWTWNED